jgi:hypothetical protein
MSIRKTGDEIAMTIQSVENRLNRVLDEAIELAYLEKSGVNGMAVARRIYESEPALMNELKERWMIERLAWQINRKRAERWRARSSQMELPGFEEMPRRILLRNGTRPRLEYSTVREVEEHLRLLRSRFKKSAQVRKMEAVLELMRRYAEDDPDITWADVKKKEMERGDFERLLKL